MQNRWTKEQTIIVFNLYCKIPFQKASSTNPDIVRTAKIIGRSPSSVKMKIGNFGSFDPELRKKGIVGLSNVSKLDKDIWDEFNSNWGKLAYESELLIAKFLKKDIGNVNDVDLTDIPEGKDRLSAVKARINQNFFRQAVLSANNYSCCITGIKVPQLLIASHIIPWSKRKETQLNPRNGLCLNALHDKAFDSGFITISTEYRIKISNVIYNKYKNDTNTINWFNEYQNNKINLPERFVPEKQFLEYHHENIFLK